MELGYVFLGFRKRRGLTFYRADFLREGKARVGFGESADVEGVGCERDSGAGESGGWGWRGPPGQREEGERGRSGDRNGAALGVRAAELRLGSLLGRVGWLARPVGLASSAVFFFFELRQRGKRKCKGIYNTFI